MSADSPTKRQATSVHARGSDLPIDIIDCAHGFHTARIGLDLGEIDQEFDARCCNLDLPYSPKDYELPARRGCAKFEVEIVELTGVVLTQCAVILELLTTGA